MRLALISDLHGNITALEAVFADIERRGVDRTICLGDTATLGPQPLAVLELLDKKNCPSILGNHDEFMLDAQLIQSYSEVPIIVSAVEWCRAELGKKELEFIEKFPRAMRPADEVFLFHGTPRSNMEDLLATTPAEKVDEMLAQETTVLMAGGHTHLQMLRQHKGFLLLNPGSTGMPFKEYAFGKAPVILPHAEYATVEVDSAQKIEVTLHRVEVDQSRLRRSIVGSKTPLKNALLSFVS